MEKQKIDNPTHHRPCKLLVFWDTYDGFCKVAEFYGWNTFYVFCESLFTADIEHMYFVDLA